MPRAASRPPAVRSRPVGIPGGHRSRVRRTALTAGGLTVAASLFRGGPISVATRDAVIDDTCCDLDDSGADGYDTNVRLLIQQAEQLNPSRSAPHGSVCSP